MNCIDFRRILRTDPGSRDPDFLAHKRDCRACSDTVARAARFERRLRQAVRVDVPENLASRILLKHSFAAPATRRRRRSRRVAAVAAAVLLVAGATALLLGPRLEAERLEREFVTLVNEAPYALTAEGPVAAEALAAALRPMGLGLDDGVGKVTFAGRCIVRGVLSGHVVLEGETAPVTVFLVPDVLVHERATIRSEFYSGVVLPAERGTIAIVSTPGETLEGVEERVRAAVRWPV